MIYIITNKTEYLKSSLPFSIIIIGIMCASGYLPFQNILIMMNRPSSQSLLIIYVAIVNIFFNTLLIPFLGMKGASLGTALSYISYVFILRYFSKAKANLII